MSRPKIFDEPRVATAIRLPTSLRDELQAAATARDVSVNYLVTRAIGDYLQRLPKIDPYEGPTPRSAGQHPDTTATS
jgi:hypothetical protein